MEIPIFHWFLKFCLIFIGLWPENPKLLYQFLLYLSVLVITPFQIKDIIVLYENTSKMLDGVRDTAVIILIVTKFSFVRVNKGNLHSLFMDIEKDWKNIKDSEERAIMEKYAKYAHKFCVTAWSFYAVTGCTYFLEFFLVYYTNKTGKRILFAPATYPFDLNPLSRFIPAVMFQFLLFSCWACANSLAETLLASLTFHVVARIEVLCNEISKMTFSKNPSTDNDDLIKFIRRIVNQHRKLIIISEKIEVIYRYVCLTQFFTSTILLCLAGFLIISSVGALEISLIVKYLCFMFLMLLQSFAFCFSGEMLLTKSDSIPQSISDSTWYETSPKNVKLLIMIILRTQKPMTLSVGKFTELSIKAFTKILQTSASYLSVLRTTY